MRTAFHFCIPEYINITFSLFSMLIPYVGLVGLHKGSTVFAPGVKTV